MDNRRSIPKPHWEPNSKADDKTANIYASIGTVLFVLMVVVALKWLGVCE